jgi:hypothetical protein
VATITVLEESLTILMIFPEKSKCFVVSLVTFAVRSERLAKIEWIQAI